jgi:hypothetical protein
MTPEISWLTVKRLVSRFDDTALGQERLAEKGGADNLMVIEGNPPLKCEFCHKPGHPKDSCWTADPSKTPQWFREEKPPPRPGKKPTFEFPKADDDMSTLWDMSAAYKAWDDQNLFDDFSPLERVTYLMDFIVVDTGASNLLLLLRDPEEISELQVVDKHVGTAHPEGRLAIRGIEKAGEQTVYHCPDIRRPVIALERLHSWRLNLILLYDERPQIRSGETVVLRGFYHRGMPVFHLEHILQLARNQERDAVMRIQQIPPPDDDDDDDNNDDDANDDDERLIYPMESIIAHESYSDGFNSISAMIKKSYETPAEPGWDTGNLTGQLQQNAVNQTAHDRPMTTEPSVTVLCQVAHETCVTLTCQAAPEPTVTTDMPAGGPQQEVVCQVVCIPVMLRVTRSSKSK